MGECFQDSPHAFKSNKFLGDVVQTKARIRHCYLCLVHIQDRRSSDLMQRHPGFDAGELPAHGEANEGAHDPGLGRQLGLDAALDALQHARHRHEQRRPQRGDVVRQLPHIALQMTSELVRKTGPSP